MRPNLASVIIISPSTWLWHCRLLEAQNNKRLRRNCNGRALCSGEADTIYTPLIIDLVIWLQIGLGGKHTRPSQWSSWHSGIMLQSNRTPGDSNRNVAPEHGWLHSSAITERMSRRRYDNAMRFHLVQINTQLTCFRHLEWSAQH